MASLTIVYNNLILFCLVFIISLFLLIKVKKEYSEEGLLDYGIYLTTKINLFFICLSSLFISVILLVNYNYNILGFVSELISMLLVYSFFNYGLFYFIKFWAYIKDFVEKNDLYQTKFFKEKVGGKK